MKPSALCKKVTGHNLKFLALTIGKSEATLINWHRDNPVLFRLVLLGFVLDKSIVHDDF